MLIAALFITAQTRNKRRRKNCYIHTIEHYRVLQGNEVQIHATWMNLENILLRERSQLQMTTYYMVSFI